MNLVIKIVSIVMWLVCLGFLVFIGVVIGMNYMDMTTSDWVMIGVCIVSNIWYSFVFIELAIKE